MYLRLSCACMCVCRGIRSTRYQTGHCSKTHRDLRSHDCVFTATEKLSCIYASMPHMQTHHSVAVQDVFLQSWVLSTPTVRITESVCLGVPRQCAVPQCYQSFCWSKDNIGGRWINVLFVLLPWMARARYWLLKIKYVIQKVNSQPCHSWCLKIISIVRQHCEGCGAKSECMV